MYSALQKITFAVFLVVLPFTTKGQSLKPIRLNQHYYEIPESDSVHHVYNKLVSYSADSTKIERIFDLENKINRIIRTEPRGKDYQELQDEYFGKDGSLTSKTTANLANSKFIRTYFQADEQVGQVIYRGEHKYTIYRKGFDKPKEALENDFEPNPDESKSDFWFFISQRTKFSQLEWPSIRKTVVIGLFIDEMGQVRQVEWANPMGAEKRVADKYLKAFKAWKKGFRPAKDLDGQPISAWKYYHFHLGGRFENSQMVIKIQ